jgi:hypothetical protein
VLYPATSPYRCVIIKESIIKKARGSLSVRSGASSRRRKKAKNIELAIIKKLVL